jgi:hypothetical protein
VARFPQAHNATDCTQEVPTCTHTAAVLKSLPSKDSVSHPLQRQYTIGAYTKRPSHIMRYISQSSNRTYITDLHALAAIGRPSVFTNQTMGFHLPRSTQYNVCGTDFFSNQHLFHNPTCKIELLCASCVWVLSLCLSGLCFEASQKPAASIFSVKVNRMIMQSGCIYIHYECTYVCMHVCIYVCTYVRMYACMYVCMYVRMSCPWDTRYEGILGGKRYSSTHS